MSYDAHMEIDTGGHHPVDVCEIGNMTSNLSGVWSLAIGRSLPSLDGTLASEMTVFVSDGLNALRTPSLRAGFDELMPANGWGDFDSAVDYLERISRACIKHPKATFRISF